MYVERAFITKCKNRFSCCFPIYEKCIKGNERHICVLEWSIEWKKGGKIAIETVSERSFPTALINDSKLDSLKNIIIDNLTIFILYDYICMKELVGRKALEKRNFYSLFVLDHCTSIPVGIGILAYINKLKYIMSFFRSGPFTE